MNTYTRRQFIKRSMLGLTVVAIGSGASFSLFPRSRAHAQGNGIELGMITADVEMVDGIMVPHWVYTVDGRPTLPGPVIFAFENEDIHINVTNNIDGGPRRFAIVGNDFSGNQFSLVRQSADIPSGETGSLTIAAGSLAPGTYLYKDPSLDPLSRVLGLHGALVILPSPAATNPYGGASTPNVTALFDSLGVGIPRHPESIFPGQPWFATTDANPHGYHPHHNDSDHHHQHHFITDPNGPQSPVFERFLYRTRIWLHSSIDPVINRAVIDDENIPDPATLKDIFLPQYFSINGRQGAFGMHSPDVFMMGTVGEPHVIRLLNAGLANHSPHIHGNHVYITSVNNVVGGGGVIFGNEVGADNIFFVDTVTLGPEDRIDWVVPFIRPPDIPRVVGNDGLLVSLAELIPQELNTLLLVPQNPLGYPMHSHMELDQTAAGGNYPQGALTGWEITGEFGANFNAQPVPTLGIRRFRVTSTVRLSRNLSVEINLRVRNTGSVEGSALATVVGVQAQTDNPVPEHQHDGPPPLYSQTLSVSAPVGGGLTSFSFPPYTPTVLGDIVWTVSLQGATATMTTRVR